MNWFEASDGARIAYRDDGDVARTPILFLHGLMANAGFFHAQADLARHFRLVGVDLRGHGQSGTGEQPVTIGRMAQDITELTAWLDLDGAIVVGWSLGATVMWEVLNGPARRRFAGAVVVDMTACVCNGPDWSLGLSVEACTARSEAMRADYDQFARNAGAAIFAPRPDGARHPLADWAGGEFARNDPEVIAASWTSLVEEDARPLLARIDQPTLIVHGAQSGLYRQETAEYLADTLPDARRVRFDLSGHAPQSEEPALFNQTILEFAAGLGTARRTAIA